MFVYVYVSGLYFQVCVCVRLYVQPTHTVMAEAGFVSSSCFYFQGLCSCTFIYAVLIFMIWILHVCMCSLYFSLFACVRLYVRPKFSGFMFVYVYMNGIYFQALCLCTFIFLAFFSCFVYVYMCGIYFQALCVCTFICAIFIFTLCAAVWTDNEYGTSWVQFVSISGLYFQALCWCTFICTAFFQAICLCTFICAAVWTDNSYGTGGGWVQFVSISGLVFTSILYTLYIFQVVDRVSKVLPAKWPWDLCVS